MTVSKIDSNIFLLDSQSIDFFIMNNPNYKKIITFDFESHNMLQENNIEHMQSDDFITNSEIKELNKKSFVFSEWYDEFNISKFLFYKEFNLGKLFYIDFYVFLLPIIKKYFEIQKIYSNFQDEKFSTSSNLYSIINKFTNNVELLENNDTIQDNFYLDKINYKFKIKNKSFNITLSKKYYQQLKNYTDKIFKKIFNKKLDTAQKSHLLIEFDTIKYKNLFSNFPNSSNFILYNRRRPLMWNIESLSIIKNSNSSFFTENELLIPEVKRAITDSEIWINETILNLKESDSHFESFFSINNSSFWPIIKNSFFELCTSRFKEIIKEIEITNQLFQKINFSSIVILSEIGTTEQIISNLAKTNHIPIVLLQHGLYYDHPLAKNMNIFQGILPMNSDIFAIWGNVMNNYSKEMGLDPTKIRQIGSPSFDSHFEIDKRDLKEKYILLAAQGPTDNLISDLDVKLYEKYVETIKKICHVVKSLNQNLIIKMHPDPHDLDLRNIVNNIDPNITVIKEGSIINLIKDCKVFVAIDISTTILEAQILKKPTMSIEVKNYSLGDSQSKIFESKSCIRTDIENFKSYLSKILYEEDFRKRLVQNGSNFVDEYLSHQKNSSKHLIQLLEKL